LGRRLQLQWLTGPIGPPTPASTGLAAATTQSPLPPLAALQPLRDALRLGYFRGAIQAIDALQARHPTAASTLALWRARVQGFEFEALLAELQRLPHGQESA
jgi:hypothetical protein